MALNNMRVPIIGQHFSLNKAADKFRGQELEDAANILDFDRLILKLLDAAKR